MYDRKERPSNQLQDNTRLSKMLAGDNQDRKKQLKLAILKVSECCTPLHLLSVNQIKWKSKYHMLDNAGKKLHDSCIYCPVPSHALLNKLLMPAESPRQDQKHWREWRWPPLSRKGHWDCPPWQKKNILAILLPLQQQPPFPVNSQSRDLKSYTVENYQYFASS